MSNQLGHKFISLAQKNFLLELSKTDLQMSKELADSLFPLILKSLEVALLKTFKGMKTDLGPHDL